MDKVKKVLLTLLICGVLHAAVYAGGNGYIMGHITTCTGLLNNYPADTKNWFYRGQDKIIQYWCYMLFPGATKSIQIKDTEHLFLNTYEMYTGGSSVLGEDTDKYVFENKWIDPNGKVICSKIVNWDKGSAIAKKIIIDSKEYIPYIFANYIEIDTAVAINGQDSLPEKQGLYHINLYVNGKPAAVTFFEMKN